MPIFTGIVLYIILFWLLLFTVLPFGNRPDEEIETGNATSAPQNPRIKRKFIITAVIAAIVWLIVYTLIRIDVIDFYQIAKEMSEEDNLK